MPWHELLVHMVATNDALDYHDEPRAAYRMPSVEILTRNGVRYVSSWEGIELRGSSWWRKVRWNRV